ncbi:MAG: cyclase family protein [Solirubrobacteraceae bacterium]|nr:MAG: cyclase [Solirubrobacterales bacterium]
MAGEIIDISVPIRAQMPIYANNPGVELTRHSSIARGDTANVSRLDFGVHTGTHLDAPLHFFDDGSDAAAIPLEPLIGPALVIDATWASGVLDGAAVQRMAIPAGTERVLVKTTNSWLWERPDFTRDFLRFDAGGAQALVDAGVRLIGIDYLSIADQDGHRVLLGLGEAGVIPLEGLDLRHVEPGEYELIVLPLRLQGSDGGPARAVLMRR